MSRFADLHIHTNFSDSTSSPEEIVAQAKEKNLSCIAITDHDTVDGIQPTMDIAAENDIEVISGIELSTFINGKDVHMLGYLFDFKDMDFIKHLDNVQNSRIERMKEMIGKLDQLGMKGIKLEEVCDLAKSKAVGRPHLAQIMIEYGFVRNIKEAFDKYLASGCPVFVDKFKQHPYEGIEMIRKIGGVAVLAHPMVTQVDELIPSLVEAGLGGIEVYYPNTGKNIIQYYEGIAKKHNIVATGGSDAHGMAKRNTYLGHTTVPYEVVEQLRAAKA